MPLVLGLKDLALRRSEDAAGQEPAVRGLGAVVVLHDAGPASLLGHQFADGLKEVHVGPQHLVHRREGLKRRPGDEAVVADEAAQDHPVLLLDVRLIVLDGL